MEDAVPSVASGYGPPRRVFEVIDWLSKQPWSNGNVGTMGISWGGFNAIQMALRHPPALKAIIAVCATENYFTTTFITLIGGFLDGYRDSLARFFEKSKAPISRGLAGRWNK
jgi:predicted acyl esterase